MGNANSGKKGDQIENGKNLIVILSQGICSDINMVIDRWILCYYNVFGVFLFLSPSIFNEKYNIDACTRPIQCLKCHM
jgi:hypothetical protein